MLTTSRREIFADDVDVNEKITTTSVDSKILGKQSFDAGVETRKASEKNVNFSNSYFASEEKAVASKLFGTTVGDYEWNEFTQADAENFTNPDLMPSSATMQNHSEVKVPYFDTKQNSQNISDVKLSTKNKIAIVSYVALVLALVLIISLTAIAVNATMTQVSDLQIEIKETMAQIDEMYADVETNADAYASQLGLVNLDQASTGYFNTVSTREAINYEISNNWFNQLCEWVSSAFGG